MAENWYIYVPSGGHPEDFEVRYYDWNYPETTTTKKEEKE